MGAVRSVDPFDASDLTWTPVSPRLALMRRVIALVACAAATAVVAVAVWLSDWSQLWWLVPAYLVVTVWELVLTGRQVRAWGYAEREDDLLIRSGIMWRRIVVVPYGRLQFVDVAAGPLERLFGVATVQLHTAAATSDSRIPGLEPREAARLRDAIADRGQARLAGL